MKKHNMAIGPGAPSLILIILVISLGILGMLSMMSARNDDKLSERAADVIERVYDLNGRSERSVMLVDDIVYQALEKKMTGDEYYRYIEAALPAYMEIDENVVYWVEEQSLSAQDAAGMILQQVTGKQVSGGKGMECRVQIIDPDESDSGESRVQWITHRTITE